MNDGKNNALNWSRADNRSKYKTSTIKAGSEWDEKVHL